MALHFRLKCPQGEIIFHVKYMNRTLTVNNRWTTNTTTGRQDIQTEWASPPAQQGPIPASRVHNGEVAVEWVCVVLYYCTCDA